jgi:hypothetical protein
MDAWREEDRKHSDTGEQRASTPCSYIHQKKSKFSIYCILCCIFYFLRSPVEEKGNLKNAVCIEILCLPTGIGEEERREGGRKW